MVKVEKFEDKKVLSETGLYRYLLKPGEEHGDQKRRATDGIWSKDTYRLERIVKKPEDRVLYYLENGPKRVFVFEELMSIPEDTQLPPDWVQKW